MSTTQFTRREVGYRDDGSPLCEYHLTGTHLVVIRMNPGEGPGWCVYNTATTESVGDAHHLADAKYLAERRTP